MGPILKGCLLEMGRTGCPKTSLPISAGNTPDEQRSYLTSNIAQIGQQTDYKPDVDAVAKVNNSAP